MYIFVCVYLCGYMCIYLCVYVRAWCRVRWPHSLFLWWAEYRSREARFDASNAEEAGWIDCAHHELVLRQRDRGRSAGYSDELQLVCREANLLSIAAKPRIHCSCVEGNCLHRALPDKRWPREPAHHPAIYHQPGAQRLVRGTDFRNKHIKRECQLYPQKSEAIPFRKHDRRPAAKGTNSVGNCTGLPPPLLPSSPLC